MCFTITNQPSSWLFGTYMKSLAILTSCNPLHCPLPINKRFWFAFGFGVCSPFGGRKEDSISLWWMEEGETAYIGLQMWFCLASVVFRWTGKMNLDCKRFTVWLNWLAGSPFWNKPSSLEQLHMEHVLKHGEWSCSSKKLCRFCIFWYE